MIVDQDYILTKYLRHAEAGRPYTWFNYQPINLPGYEITLAHCGRRCFDRSQSIISALEERFSGESLRIIDWGCNLGFFLFELAKRGHQVVGVDRDEEMVAICSYLAHTNDFLHPPEFFCETLDEHSVARHNGFDVAICLSVFHHIKTGRFRTLQAFARAYTNAIVEMDGSSYGHRDLFSFYWNVQEIAHTEDRYGTGTKRRKTWFCTNQEGSTGYGNLKSVNAVPGRGVFLESSNFGKRVIKRQYMDSRHTWIDTDLDHETQVYIDFTGSRFFPRLLEQGETSDYRWIALEYIENDGSCRATEVAEFFAFLRRERLFIIDLRADSFLFRNGCLFVVDVESMFRVHTTIASLIREKTRREHVKFDSYDNQQRYVLRRLAQ